MARKRHSTEFKGMVALEAIKNEMTIAEICAKYEVAPTVYYEKVPKGDDTLLVNEINEIQYSPWTCTHIKSTCCVGCRS